MTSDNSRNDKGNGEKTPPNGVENEKSEYQIWFRMCADYQAQAMQSAANAQMYRDLLQEVLEVCEKLGAYPEVPHDFSHWIASAKKALKH